MKWIEICIMTTDEGAEAVYAMLDKSGISSVVIEQSRESIQAFLTETEKYWDYADPDEIAPCSGPCVKAYIADIPENAKLIDKVYEETSKLKNIELGFDVGSLEISARTVDDEDWSNNWKAYYKPIPIGNKLLVKPSWEEVQNPDGRTVISLDPGIVFGTGSHQTTRMCIKMLEQTVEKSDVVLDIGCGSGILMIAALLLGADKAVGADVDAAALHVVKDNAGLNGIDPKRFSVYIGDVLTDPSLKENLEAYRYDVIVSNITANVIIRLVPFAAQLIKPGGSFIVSGIIGERLDEVLTALNENGFKAADTEIMDDWVAVLSEKL